MSMTEVESYWSEAELCATLQVAYMRLQRVIAVHRVAPAFILDGRPIYDSLAVHQISSLILENTDENENEDAPPATDGTAGECVAGRAGPFN